MCEINVKFQIGIRVFQMINFFLSSVSYLLCKQTKNVYTALY